MDLTTALTGALPFIILVSAALTMIFSFLLLWLYRRAVIRSMGAGGGSNTPTEVTSTQVPADNLSPLTITTLKDKALLQGRAKVLFDATSVSLQRLALVYGVAGVIYALVLSLPWMITAGGGFPLVRLLWLFVCYAWPGVIVVAVVAATSQSQKQLIFAIYFSIVALIGAVVILLGLFGWWLLGRLGSAYRAKRMSDQSLNLDALWLMFALFQSITLAFEGWLWIFTGLVAFILYKQITRIGFSKLKSQINSEKPPSVLLLRVFSLGRKSERMFDTLSRRWLRVGNIDMIAGPDLVTSTVEPHEFLDYMGGHLSRSFIDTPSVFEKRFSFRNCRPDPDGRYRVNEFFCRNDTWQICMQRLAAECDVVLMDLRSFSKRNQGCLWELEQLLTTVSLDRILFVVDDTTDKTFLEQQLQRLWKQHPGSSPNLGLAKPQVKLFSVQSTVPRVADQLTKRLFEACYPTNSP